MLKMKSNPIDDEDVRVSVEVRGHRRLVDKIGVSGHYHLHQILSDDNVLHPWASSDSGSHLLDPVHRAPSHGTS